MPPTAEPPTEKLTVSGLVVGPVRVTVNLPWVDGSAASPPAVMVSVGIWASWIVTVAEFGNPML